MDSNLRRLTSCDRDEVEVLILAELREHGPDVFSAIQARLRDRIPEHLLYATLKALVAGGRASFAVKQFERVDTVYGVERTLPYRAREYIAVVGGKAKPKRVAPELPAKARPGRSGDEEHKALILADLAAHG